MKCGLSLAEYEKRGNYQQDQAIEPYGWQIFQVKYIRWGA